MATVNNLVGLPPVLIGWKAIGAALGVSASTARRWSREMGLPFYRLGGQIRSRTEDLLTWEGKIARKK